MFRYEVTPKIRTAISLRWYVWAESESQARAEQCAVLNAESIHSYPPWTPDEFNAKIVGEYSVK